MPTTRPPGPPRRLFKYRPFDTWTLELLASGENFYASPRQFNDPLDCRPVIETDLDNRDLERLCFAFMQGTRGPQGAIVEISNLRHLATEAIDGWTEEAHFEALLRQEIGLALDLEMAPMGVLSLSATWNSPLMWSHYAEEHRGVCIEYDTTEVSHGGLRPVRYGGGRGIKASDLLGWKVGGSTQARDLVSQAYFLPKAAQWRYEREWRDVSERGGLGDGAFRITAIHLGMRCPPAVVQALSAMLQDRSDIAIFEIYPENMSFRLARHRVDVGEILSRGLRLSPTLEFKDILPAVDGE